MLKPAGVTGYIVLFIFFGVLAIISFIAVSFQSTEASGISLKDMLWTFAFGLVSVLALIRAIMISFEKNNKDK